MVESYIVAVESADAETLLVVAYIAQGEVKVVVEIDSETSQVGDAAVVVELEADALVVADEVRQIGADGIHLAVEINILEYRKHLHIVGVEFAVTGSDAEAPFVAWNEYVVEQATVESSQIAFGNYDIHGVVTHHNHGHAVFDSPGAFSHDTLGRKCATSRQGRQNNGNCFANHAVRCRRLRRRLWKKGLF